MTTKKKILIVIGVLTGLSLTLLFGANWGFIGLTKDTFSINFDTEKVLLSFDTERDFHGDGFSIEVYQLDKESQEYSKNPSADFFTSYPKRHYHLGDYKIFKWEKTPLRLEDNYRTEFATRPDAEYKSWIFPEDKNAEIENYLSKADKYLQSEGNYYAMFFQDHPYKLYGIDLYIISPTDGLLFKINRQ